MASAFEATDRRVTTDRRRRRGSFHLPERRTGFDRRLASAVGGRGRWQRRLAALRDMPGIVALIVAVVVALNAVDLILTLIALERGATEANPVMAELLAADPWIAAAFKGAVGFAVGMALWRLRRFKAVLALSIVLLAGFTLLTAYHLLALTVLAPA